MIIYLYIYAVYIGIIAIGKIIDSFYICMYIYNYTPFPEQMVTSWDLMGYLKWIDMEIIRNYGETTCHFGIGWAIRQFLGLLDFSPLPRCSMVLEYLPTFG